MYSVVVKSTDNADYRKDYEVELLNSNEDTVFSAPVTGLHVDCRPVLTIGKKMQNVFSMKEVMHPIWGMHATSPSGTEFLGNANQYSCSNEDLPPELLPVHFERIVNMSSVKNTLVR